MSSRTTPFDPLLSDLMQNTLGNPAFPMPPSTIGKRILPHLYYLRTAYLAFPRSGGAAEIHAKNTEWSSMSPELKNASMADDAYNCKYAYFGFIDALNQVGRHMSAVKVTLPLFPRLRFFRNKVIEHWDDYLANRPGNGSVGKAGTITIPLIFGSGRVEVAQMKSALPALVAEFAASGQTIALTTDEWYGDYAEKIWKALEAIDSDLHSEIRSKKNRTAVFIPDSLVKLLFAYEFPLPFYDVDAYCSSLVTDLRSAGL